MADQIPTTSPLDDGGPLTEAEIATCVAECADKILALTEDPGEQERIVNDLGDVLEGWNNSFPLLTSPLKVVVDEIFVSQKNHVQKVSRQKDRP